MLCDKNNVRVEELQNYLEIDCGSSSNTEMDHRQSGAPTINIIMIHDLVTFIYIIQTLIFCLLNFAFLNAVTCKTLYLFICLFLFYFICKTEP